MRKRRTRSDCNGAGASEGPGHGTEGQKYHGSTPSSENIFAGLIRCGHCGRKMRIRTEYKEKPIYCKSVTTAPNASCYPKKYKQKELEELVLIMIRQQAALAEDTIKQLKKANQTLNIPKLRYRKSNMKRSWHFVNRRKWNCMNNMQKKRFP